LVADGDGSLVPQGSPTHDDRMAVDRWRKDACDHPDGIVVRKRLGNSAMVSELRLTLAAKPDAFPLLLRLVLYSGVHAGDYIATEVAKQISVEVDALLELGLEDPVRRRAVQEFGHQIRDLIDASVESGKPIAF
jgi:hypothetical protein